MTKTKIISIVVGLALLLVAVPVFFLLTLDLNQYKALMVDVVQQETGRELRLTGPLEKSLFPWLGIKIGALSLGNAKGFEHQQVFAAIEEAQVKVEFWPLLQRRLVVDTMVLHGLQLHLMKNKNGQTNFQDLLDKAAPAQEPSDKTEAQTETEAESAELPVKDFKIGGLDLNQANVSWQDDQAGQRFEVKQLNLRTGEIETLKPVDFDLSMQLMAQLAGDKKTEPVSQNATVQVSGNMKADVAKQQATITGLKLSVGLDKGNLPIDIKEVKLSADLSLDAKKSTANLSKLDLRTLGLKFTGTAQTTLSSIQAKLSMKVQDAAVLNRRIQSLMPDSKLRLSEQGLTELSFTTDVQADLDKQSLLMPLTLALPPMKLDARITASNFLDKPRFNGKLNIDPFSPKAVIQKLGLELPQGMDQKALQSFKASFGFKGGLDALTLKPIQLHLDDSKLKGEVSVNLKQGPGIQYQLSMNRLNLDHYIPPAPIDLKGEKAKPATKPETATATEIELPLELMRKLKVNGTFNLGSAVVNRIKIKNLKTGVAGAKGLYKVDPLSLQLYGGSLEAQASLDVRGDIPLWSVKEKLHKVRFGDLVKDATNEDLVSGVANINVSLTGQGLSPQKNRDKLNGSLKFHFTDGNAQYVNLMDILLKDYSKQLKKAVPEKEPTNATVFKELKGTASISNGVLKNNDLWLSSSPITVKGRGTANLVTEQLDFVMDTTIVKPTKAMKKIKLDELQGEVIPIKIYGSILEPKHKIDFGAVLERKAKKAIERKKTKLKEKAKKSVEKRKQKAKEKLKEKLREKFKF